MGTPLNPLNTPSQSAIYRPKYRARTENGQYELEGIQVVTQTNPSLLDSLDALERWCRQEQEANKKSAPRWRPEKATALKIYIEPKLLSSLSPRVLRACQAWMAASNGWVNLRITVRMEEADIWILSAEETIMGRPFELGHTDNTIEGQWLVRSKITLVTQPIIDRHLSASQISDRLYATLLHELGHSLGLSHSDNKADVMHHRGWKNQQLSPHDIQQVVSLYAPQRQMLYTTI